VVVGLEAQADRHRPIGNHGRRRAPSTKSDAARDAAAWILFVAFVLSSSFVVLNLFIGLIVKAMEEPAAGVVTAEQPRQEIVELRQEIAALRRELRALSADGAARRLRR
jgi:hypothetical protein